MNTLPVPITNNTFKVIAFTHPLRDEMVQCDAPLGMSVSEVLEGLPKDKLSVWVNGEHLDVDRWDTFLPTIKHVVIVRAVPQKEGLRLALQIGIIVAATYFSGALGLAAGKLASAAFIGGVTLAGNLLLNALIPPAAPKPPEGDQDFTRLASLTGARNQVASFTPVPRLYGRMRYYPPAPMTGTPFTYLVGDEQYLKALFVLGYGPLMINAVRVDGVDPLNSDQHFMTGSLAYPETKWYNNHFQNAAMDSSIVVGTVGGPYGSNGVTVTKGIGDSSSEQFFSERVPVTSLGIYTIDVWGYQSAGARGHSFNVAFYDENGVLIDSGTTDATGWDTIDSYHNWRTFTGYDSVWTRYRLVMGSGQATTIPSDAAYMAIGANLCNSGSTAAQTIAQLSRYRVSRYRGVIRAENYPNLQQAIFIGENTLADYPGTKVELGDAEDFTLYSQSIFEERVDLAMDSTLQSGGQVVTDNVSAIRTTQPETDEIAVDWEFPNGCFSIAENGSNQGVEVSWKVEYRVAGSMGAWTAIDFTETIQGWADDIFSMPWTIVVNSTTYAVRSAQRQTVRRGVKWSVPNGQYEVQITRVQTNTYGVQVGSSDAIWLSLKSITKDRPFSMPGVVCMAIDIKASDNLSGALDNVSVLAQSILTRMVGPDPIPFNMLEEATSSPAWAFLDVLRGSATRRPLAVDAIDYQALIDWFTACNANGFEFNMVVEGQTTVLELLRIIAAAGRATWGIKNNLHSVIREETEQVPRQLFSPRNATNFKLKKFYPKVPHALRVQFVDSTTYKDSERFVYDDGYTSENATLYETIQLPGVTLPDQAWKLGRFHLAQMRLRPEQWTFDAHIDQLIAQRGDAIAIHNDMFLNGLRAGRITAVTTGGGGGGGGGYLPPGYLPPGYLPPGYLPGGGGGGGSGVTQFSVDETFFMEAGPTYKVVVRYIDAAGRPALVTRTITTVTPSTKVITPTTALPGEVQIGDLVTFGTVPTIDAKITKISPHDAYSATITAVPLATPILSADTGTIPDFDPLLDQPIDFNNLPPPAPVITRVRSDETVLTRDGNGSLRVQMVVDYLFPPGQPEVRVEMRHSLHPYTLQWFRTVGNSDDQKIATTQVEQGFIYRVEIRAINAAGKVSNWSDAVLHEVIGKSNPPSDVQGFTATMESFAILLQWGAVLDLDLSHYEIRLGTVWETAAFIVETRATRFRFNDPFLGAPEFLIKAVDTSGNESVTAASVTLAVDIEPPASLVLYPEVGGVTVEIDTSLLNPRGNDLVHIRIGTVNDRDHGTTVSYRFPLQANLTASDLFSAYIPLPSHNLVHYAWARFEDIFGNVSVWFPIGATAGIAGAPRSPETTLFEELFEGYQSEDELRRFWDVIGSPTIEFTSDGHNGGKALTVTNSALFISKRLIPYYPDEDIYRFSLLHKRLVAGAQGDTLILGFVGVKEDGRTFVSFNGGESPTPTITSLVTGDTDDFSAIDQWWPWHSHVAGRYAGTIQGGAFNRHKMTFDPYLPKPAVRYLRPAFWVNRNDIGSCAIDNFVIDTLPNPIASTIVDPLMNVDPNYYWLPVGMPGAQPYGIWAPGQGVFGGGAYKFVVNGLFGGIPYIQYTSLLAYQGTVLTLRVRYRISGTITAATGITARAQGRQPAYSQGTRNWGGVPGLNTVSDTESGLAADNNWYTVTLVLDLSTLVGESSAFDLVLFPVGNDASHAYTMYIGAVTPLWS